ncbi:MAG: AraC family transcriptional regulator [Pseudomonadota bacterium]|nr:AraC family transcriptional regulator [Pseudomonadota bacterium]
MNSDNNQIKMLATSIHQLTRIDNYVDTKVPGLTVFKKTEANIPQVGMYEPSVCLIAQGAKKVLLGHEQFIYDTQHYIFSCVHLPVVSQVIDASNDTPYLGLKLNFDYQELALLIADLDLPLPKNQKASPGMATGDLTDELINAFQRLINLEEESEHIHILAPIIRREIFYRLLTGEQGEKLMRLSAMGTHTQQVAQSISWIKTHFAQSINIEMLAEMANMASSTFHQHFRKMTAMSPLQYIKQLRLQEARKLMLTQHFDASRACFHVGYDSPSQFSREYKRLFGDSPAKHITKLRNNLSSKS